MDTPFMPRKTIKDRMSDLVRMLKANHEPHEVALGVAIGVFIAVLPVYGFHTLLCVVAAILVRKANKLAILIGTNISLPPTIAIITWTAYDVGRFVMPGKNYPPISWDYIRHFHMARIHEFYYPLFIGSLVLGVICALVFYGITFLVVRYFKKKREGTWSRRS